MSVGGTDRPSAGEAITRAAPAPEAGVLAAWLRVPERVRALVAILLCAALCAADLILTVEMNEAQLYPLAIVLLYRVQTRNLIWTVVGIAVLLTIGGYLLVPTGDVWDGVTNRTFSVLLIVGTGFALTRVAAYEQILLIQTLTDPLTGLLNRRRFTELSLLEAARAQRHGQPFAVMMVDIDHFKRINDTHGHPVGDVAIKLLANACSARIRPHDILARYGGEEFVLTLPQTGSEGALVVGERVRHAAEQVVIPTERDAVHFTVSVGIATHRSGQPFDEVVSSADAALYRAKEGGRNRVELHARQTWRPRNMT
jgi:diguanylate cyclase (GGDEF)-like protein